MMVSVSSADIYVSANCIDIDEWAGADEAKKQRTLNVASRNLAVAYPKYTIPDAAVYEFTNVLITLFGDATRLAQQGVTGYTVTGVISLDFKDSAVNEVGGNLRKYIPQSALDLIGAENGVTLSKRASKWAVM